MKSSSPTVYSSALSSKGALLDETLTILRQIDAGCGVDEVRGMVMDDDLLHKTTMYTRRSSWNNIHARFLIDPEFATLLSSMVVHAPDRQTGRLILLYEFCRSSAILHDTTVHCIYPRYAAGYSAISTADMQNHFDDVSAQHPELADWSPQTRDKVASNILTILRDFGLLRGARPKQFARLYVSLPAFVYVLYRIAGAEATSAEETVEEAHKLETELKGDEEEVLLKEVEE